MDEPTSACPNCGTPRGPYDRFCTGCAADLGAPGAPIGLIGTLGEMNVAGPSSRQTARAQAAPAPRSVVGWVVPGSRSRPFTTGTPVPAIARGGQLSGLGGYQSRSTATGATRLWRTLGLANRIIAVMWIAILLAALASYLARRPDPSLVVGFVAVNLVFAIPALVLWRSAGGIVRGDPPWIRSVVFIELMIIVIFTFGLALVPLLLIFLFAGDEP
ncbi:MAG: hypothetical protein QOE66_2525 [Chloroflexota bacterium]|nr:hypothetical protein [Chloroflexota bacterium]